MGNDRRLGLLSLEDKSWSLYYVGLHVSLIDKYAAYGYGQVAVNSMILFSVCTCFTFTHVKPSPLFVPSV